MAAMTSKLNIFVFVFLSFSFVPASWNDNQKISDTVIKIFLERQFNSTDSEWILKIARESYLYLKEVEKKSDITKFNFAKKYANFLLELFKEVQIKSFDIYQLFWKENSFLKVTQNIDTIIEYNHNQCACDFNITELRTTIEDLQITIERHLVFHYNSSEERYEATKVLAFNETNFDAFLKGKFRADYSEIGYFFLEIFATLIGLSWGIISTVLHYTQSNTESDS